MHAHRIGVRQHCWNRRSIWDKCWGHFIWIFFLSLPAWREESSFLWTSEGACWWVEEREGEVKWKERRGVKGWSRGERKGRGGEEEWGKGEKEEWRGGAWGRRGSEIVLNHFSLGDYCCSPGSHSSPPSGWNELSPEGDPGPVVLCTDARPAKHHMGISLWHHGEGTQLNWITAYDIMKMVVTT